MITFQENNWHTKCDDFMWLHKGELYEQLLCEILDII